MCEQIASDLCRDEMIAWITDELTCLHEDFMKNCDVIVFQNLN